VLAGIAAVASLTLFGTLNYYQFLSVYSQGYADLYQIGAQQDRLQDAAATLPPGITAGYLSDVPLADTQGAAAFGAARYGLAPRLLVTLEGGRKPEWVVGNFTRPGDAARAGAEQGLSVFKDYGNGIVLFRRQVR
jgi:hypothetical protein